MARRIQGESNFSKERREECGRYAQQRDAASAERARLVGSNVENKLLLRLSCR
jgi:hypothetical protein